MSLFKSIATFGGFTLISRITGFLRDMVLANFLGAGAISDAFFVAFKLPNLFRSLFAEGAFTTAFVPMLSHKLVTDGKEQAVTFASQAISVLAVFLTVFVIIMEFCMPWVVEIMAPGFSSDPEKMSLSIELSRITFPFLLFISIVSFQSGILNSFGKFAGPAAAPVILNLMMIISVFIFVPLGETPAHGISWSVTIAGLVEIFWLSWFLRGIDVKVKPQTNILQLLKNSEIITLFKRIAPGVLGAGVYQINMVVDTIIVSLVGTGAISWLYYANRIQQLPLGVVGAAISVALLPILSHHLKAGEQEQANHMQDKAVEYGALMSIPAMVALIVLAYPIIDILFHHGRFTQEDSIMTAQAVIAYSIGLPSYVMVKALAPNFFARGDTKTPVKYSIIVMLANLALSIGLMIPFGHVGVATATSLASFVSLYQYLRGLKKRGYWTYTKALNIKILKITFCSVVMGAILYLTEYGCDLLFNNWLQTSYAIKIPLLGGLCVLGVASFLIMAKLTKTLDIAEILKLLKSKGKKNAQNQA